MCIALFVALLSGAAWGEEVSLDSVPPVVVKTMPEAGAADVDPGTTEIKVTFSKEMSLGSYSYVTLSKENYPETTGDPQLVEEQRTYVLPVRLFPGKTYAIWLNSEKFRNFKDTAGRSAVPYLLVFKTRE
jgi:RNA polymerase sigma-70 factor (ECF subfamily)